MFNKQYFAILFALLTLIPTLTFSQSKVGTTAAPFLTIGVGSRAIGMGGAFVSVVDDATSLYWNPAGLARLDRSEAVLIHTTYLADMSFNFVGAAFDLGRSALGASATLLDVGEMEVTTETEQDGTGIYFDSYDLCMAVSYSYMFYDHFTIGTNVKYIHQQIWHENATGFAFDIGTLLVTPLHGIRLGMCISNFGTDMKMAGKDLLTTIDVDPTKSGNNENVYAEVKMESWQLPLTMRVGLSGELINTPRERLTLALDWVHPNDNTEFLDFGIEYAYWNLITLRAGYKALRPGIETNPDFKIELSPRDSGGGITFGGGLNFKLREELNLKVDYAYESFDRLGSIHKYSLGFAF
jgi:long-subunit fatty acid transport protein